MSRHAGTQTPIHFLEVKLLDDVLLPKQEKDTQTKKQLNKPRDAIKSIYSVVQ